MSRRVGRGHSMLPPKAKLPVPFWIGCGNHPPIARGDDLPRMKRKTGDVPMWFTDLLPRGAPEDLAANSAGSVLHYGQGMLTSNLQNGFKVARHSHLVHTENGARAFSDNASNQCRIDVESLRLNINKHRGRPAVPYATGGGDERMTDGDHLITRSHADGKQCQV